MTSIKGTHSIVDSTVIHRGTDGAYCDVVHNGMELITTMRIRKTASVHIPQPEGQGLRRSPHEVLRHAAIVAPTR